MTLNAVKAKTLVDALSHTLKKDISNNCGHANLCGGQGDTLAPLKAYTVVYILIKVKDEALAYTKAHVFAQVKANSVTDTLKLY